MKFIKVSGTDEVVNKLSQTLTEELNARKKVLWIVTGGSNIGITTEVAKTINRPMQEHLTVMLSDERYGPLKHPDSNWQQLKQAGFVLPYANTVEVLTDSPLDDTIRYYAETAEKAFAQADVVIAQLGIGPDGHIAGVLPGSPGVESNEWVIGYDGTKYGGQYQRVTLTLEALRHVDKALVYSAGESRLEALQNLRDRKLSLADEPSQVLHEIPDAVVMTVLFGDVSDGKKDNQTGKGAES
jgi:6-phosphogluconolactonase/glucosamine-6-phosphate isomerase/deaminase